MSINVPAQVDLAHCRCVVGDEPLIFHCHHYNVFLLQTILDASFIDSTPFLVGGAAEVTYHQLATVFRALNVQGDGPRKQCAEELYRRSGFGTFDLSSLSADGGTVTTPHSHYAMGWKIRFGAAKTPVCYFAAGWLAGALAAIYDQPLGTFDVKQTSCGAVNAASACGFELKRGKPGYRIYTSPGVGKLSEKHERRSGGPARIDVDAIVKAVGTLPLAGNSEGHIPAFGVYLTQHFANYYNRVSFELLRETEKMFGDEGRRSLEPMLEETGHVCAFHTFGGIMSSTEWDALIKPLLQSKEDWIHGILAVVNALGWGRWEASTVSRNETVFVIQDDYESVGYLATHGQAKRNVSFLAMGGVVGLMNLVYIGEIEGKPELTPDFYNAVFKKKNGYRAEVLSSRAMGDAVTSFKVRPG